MIVSDDTGQVYIIEIQTILEKLDMNKKGQNVAKKKGYNASRKVILGSNGIYQDETEIINDL